jgi:hypothetical protein
VYLQLETRCGMYSVGRQASKPSKYQSALQKTSSAATKGSRRQTFALGSPIQATHDVDVTSRLSRDICHTNNKRFTRIYTAHLHTPLTNTQR